MKIEIPARLRAIVRARESSLIVLAAVVGVIGGLVVVTTAGILARWHVRGPRQDVAECAMRLEPGKFTVPGTITSGQLPYSKSQGAGITATL